MNKICMRRNNITIPRLYMRKDKKWDKMFVYRYDALVILLAEATNYVSPLFIWFMIMNTAQKCPRARMHIVECRIRRSAVCTTQYSANFSSSTSF